MALDKSDDQLSCVFKQCAASSVGSNVTFAMLVWKVVILQLNTLSAYFFSFSGISISSILFSSVI